MEDLKTKMEELTEKKIVEPNSDMGRALRYFKNHWEKLTLFLQKPGAPLDNNTAERLLKTPIRYRKNSLFYRTERGARVGDVNMTLIQTAKFHKVNPFDYLTAVLQNPKAVAESPSDWLPWTYQETMKQKRMGKAA
jgi:hypothetical protein